MKKLSEQGKIVREGGKRFGHWEEMQSYIDKESRVSHQMKVTLNRKFANR